MKKYLLVFSLICFTAYSQKNRHALVVYLSDAETGKNINDAKVRLEGFEISAITAKHDKKRRLYYFDFIPKGYNTVMVYHKKYNEKGFQDVNGLPSQISIKLFNHKNVSYSFEQDSYKSSTQKIYIEDPYKFGITSNKYLDYNVFREYFFNELKKLDLEVEVVNPYLELEKDAKIPRRFKGRLHSFEGKEAYPFISTYPLLDIDKFLLPLLEGVSTYEIYLESKGVPTINLKNHTVVFYIRKKNGEKFKRFNDPYLKKIRSIKDINTFSVLYSKYDFKSNEGRVYKNRDLNYLDEFNKLKDIDSSKVFYYFRIDTRSKFAKPCIKLQFHNFKMFDSLKKEYQSSSKLERIMKNNNILNCDSAIGLGVLDQFERIGDSLKLNKD